MSFVRPQVRALLWRWREVIAGGGMILLGAWAVGAGHGLLPMLGWVVVALGLAFVFAGLQRGRARGDGGGEGVVQIVEGQIAYFGPMTGGAVALSEIEALELDRRSGRAVWVLRQPGQPVLRIPVDAEGADALFDSFASLPGLPTGRIVAALHDPMPGQIVLWRRSGPASPDRQLH